MWSPPRRFRVDQPNFIFGPGHRRRWARLGDGDLRRVERGLPAQRPGRGTRNSSAAWIINRVMLRFWTGGRICRHVQASGMYTQSPVR